LAQIIFLFTPLYRLNQKDAKDYIKKTKAKEQEDIKSLMDIIICENKEALNELAK